jgi:hypothetical protein
MDPRTTDGPAQGTTFLWTQSYGKETGSHALLETLRDATLALAMALLAAGAAGFVALERLS